MWRLTVLLCFLGLVWDHWRCRRGFCRRFPEAARGYPSWPRTLGNLWHNATVFSRHDVSGDVWHRGDA